MKKRFIEEQIIGFLRDAEAGLVLDIADSFFHKTEVSTEKGQLQSDNYASTKAELCEVLETLLRAKGIVVAHADTVWKSLRLFREGNADFADCLIERRK